MPRTSKLIRPLLVLALLAGLVLAASGCGTTSADVERGRVLFVQKCGTCHTLAQAGTTAQTGPDLDDAFASAREIGETDATVEGIVSAQVESPRPVNGNSAVSMPPNIVEGQDLVDVAAYVGMYAGVPGAAPPKVPGGPGAQVFASKGCGGCHTLAVAKAGGTVGPNLDEVLPGQGMEEIHEDIADPNKVIAKGFPSNVMPATYAQTLTPKELEDLVQYLFESTSGGKASGSSKG
ncbi:MAG TPA: c-type cytochrome [Solirubrobacterales bacterium]|nr:c-type cytochrome [Solirubrobacterales bacterium]